MSKKMTKQDLKNYIVSEATKLYKIEVLKEEKKRVEKELKMLSEGEVSENPSEIKNTALNIAPKLINNPIVLNLADKISKDPKAVNDIKKYVQSMSGGISEEVEIGNDFIKKSIEKGMALSKNMQEDNMAKKMTDKELHIPLMGLTGLVGGYLADKYFYNPLIKVAEYVTPYFSDNKQITPSWHYHDATSHLAHNPTNVVIAGAIAGVFVGAVIVKVLEMISKKNKQLGENEGDGDGWTTAIMNVSEVDDFIDNYLDGWNLQYDAPIDLGNGKVSIRHQEETEDIMNQMNYQDAGERLSNMDDKSNYSMNEDSNNLRGMLHTLVGNARRLEKKADNYGGVSHHVDAYKKAEQELAIFLKQNPSMMEFLDDVEDHFINQLYK